MKAIGRLLKAIFRFLVKTGIPLLVAAILATVTLMGRAIKRFAKWWAATFKARSRRGKILFGGGSAVAACVILAFSAAVLSPDAEPTAEPIAAVDDASATPVEESPTNTPRPTDTEEPTQTSTPEPTGTPEPTDTPQSTSTPTQESTQGQQAEVVEIVDGDTIDVQIDGQIQRVRYIGMDTPERGDPFFDEAMEANRQLVEDATVRLVMDVSETDQFGRLLRYVYLEDGTFINAELVRLGFAQLATFPPDVRHEGLFRELQAEARNEGRGLWAAPVTQATAPPPTQPPQATATQAPTATNTPVPQATSTQPPAPTATQPPAPTETQPPPAPAQVVISFIFFDGQVPQVESDEYAVITNQGDSSVNLQGWRLNADDPGQDFVFPAHELAPGASCRVYTNENHPEYCGFSFGSGQALWANSGECGYLYDASGAEVSRYCY